MFYSHHKDKDIHSKLEQLEDPRNDWEEVYEG